MEKAEEYNCCMELHKIVEKKLKKRRPKNKPDVTCVTQLTGFQSVCLDPDVLETAYFQYKDEHGAMQATLKDMGQVSIYWSVRTNSMSMSNTSKKNKDMSIARRFITVAASDFMCWFPIGVLGLLSSRGIPVPGEAIVAVAIFVLPLNSAINPCRYTLNAIMERRRREREEKLRTLLLAQLKSCS